MNRDALENSATNLAYCKREMEKAEKSVELARANFEAAKLELVERALVYDRSAPPMPPMPPRASAPQPQYPPMIGQPMPAYPAPPLGGLR